MFRVQDFKARSPKLCSLRHNVFKQLGAKTWTPSTQNSRSTSPKPLTLWSKSLEKVHYILRSRQKGRVARPALGATAFFSRRIYQGPANPFSDLRSFSVPWSTLVANLSLGVFRKKAMVLGSLVGSFIMVREWRGTPTNTNPITAIRKSLHGRVTCFYMWSPLKHSTWGLLGIGSGVLGLVCV